MLRRLFKIKKCWNFYTTFFAITSHLLRLTHAQNTVNIDYKLMYSGAFEALTTFIPNQDQLDYILSHGCWCKKLDPMSASDKNLGGADPVDELDRLCKLWVQIRLCCRLEGGSCYLQEENVTYAVNYENGVEDATCEDNSWSEFIE